MTTELLVLSKLEYTKNEIVKNEMVNLNQLINEIMMLLEMKMLEKGVIFLKGEKLDITIKQNEEKLR